MGHLARAGHKPSRALDSGTRGPSQGEVCRGEVLRREDACVAYRIVLQNAPTATPSGRAATPIANPLPT